MQPQFTISKEKVIQGQERIVSIHSAKTGKELVKPQSSRDPVAFCQNSVVHRVGLQPPAYDDHDSATTVSAFEHGPLSDALPFFAVGNSYLFLE